MPYQQRLAACIASIERSILQLRHPNQPQFVGILNAIELQAEDEPVLPVVHYLAEALLELARQRGLPLGQISHLEKKLDQLQKFLRIPNDGPNRSR